jgi:DNA-binding LacI/PurR family transcriptional regulator
MTKRLSPPSAHDVARLAGVSQAAVSRAFTPGKSIAKHTQERVFRAAKSLGYRPNLLARSLIKGQSGIVGVVMGSPRNPVFMAALDALSARLSRAGKHILIFTVQDGSSADEYVDELLMYRADALLLMATDLSPKFAEQCREEGIPILSFHRPPPKTKYFASVTANHREGAQQIATHLLQQGYRRLAFMAGRDDSVTSREREAGFSAHLESEGLPAPVREVGHFQREGALEAARKLLSRKSRPDAIFCANDYMALATIEVARYEFGLEIGRQIGVAGFDDVEQASWPSYDLTSYLMPVQAMVEKVVSIVVADPALKAPAHTTVEGAFKPRGSTQRTRR